MKTLTKMVICEACDGTGASGGLEETTMACGRCKGKGHVTEEFDNKDRQLQQEECMKNMIMDSITISQMERFLDQMDENELTKAYEFALKKCASYEAEEGGAAYEMLCSWDILAGKISGQIDCQ